MKRIILKLLPFILFGILAYFAIVVVPPHFQDHAMQLTTQSISVGRVLHVYSDRWNGPRAAMVVSDNPKPSHANASIEFDFLQDKFIIGLARGRNEGPTFHDIPVFDAVEVQDAEAAHHAGLRIDALDMTIYAVWPPRK